MKKNHYFKKSTLTAIIILTLASVSFAQEDNNAKHYSDIRVLGGMNLGSLTSEGTKLTLIDSVVHSSNVDAQIGYQGGLSFTYGNRFYISPGVWYTKFTLNTQFIDDTQNNDDFDFEAESTLSMISIPVRFGFRFINPQDEDIFNMRLFGGVVGQHVISVNTVGDSEVKLDKDNYENLVMSATAGLGVDILFFFVDLGYDLGLTNFEKSNTKSRHNSMFLNVGAKFKL
jgi:hypothetical protein